MRSAFEQEAWLGLRPPVLGSLCCLATVRPVLEALAVTCLPTLWGATDVAGGDLWGQPQPGGSDSLHWRPGVTLALALQCDARKGFGSCHQGRCPCVIPPLLPGSRHLSKNTNQSGPKALDGLLCDPSGRWLGECGKASCRRWHFAWTENRRRIPGAGAEDDCRVCHVLCASGMWFC